MLMSELFILAAVPLLAAIAAWIRLRGERRARVAAETRCASAEADLAVAEAGRATAEDRTAELERTLALHEQRQRELYPVVAHELRSPIAAILGYEELLEDGTFGQLDERGLDALQRIRFAAVQLTGLVEGLDHFGVDPAAADEPADVVVASDLVTQAVAALQFDAAARGIDVRIDADPTVFRTRAGPARRALNLAMSAAVKATPRGVLLVSVRPGTIHIDGTALDPAADDPSGPPARALTGPGLRLAFALAAARQAGGTLSLEPSGSTTRVVIRLPVSD
jgi:two-component system, cell cycle sensor histidine kinase PleC